MKYTTFDGQDVRLVVDKRYNHRCMILAVILLALLALPREGLLMRARSIAIGGGNARI